MTAYIAIKCDARAFFGSGTCDVVERTSASSHVDARNMLPSGWSRVKERGVWKDLCPRHSPRRLRIVEKQGPTSDGAA